MQVALYRIAQEGFNNIVKHAQASCVSIALEVVPTEAGRRDHTWHGHIALHIADDGRGFAPTRVSAGRLGLGSMQERAAGVGAMLTISSEPGAGTSVSVRWSGRAADMEEGA